MQFLSPKNNNIFVKTNRQQSFSSENFIKINKMYQNDNEKFCEDHGRMVNDSRAAKFTTLSFGSLKVSCKFCSTRNAALQWFYLFRIQHIINETSQSVILQVLKSNDIELRGHIQQRLSLSDGWNFYEDIVLDVVGAKQSLEFAIVKIVKYFVSTYEKTGR